MKQRKKYEAYIDRTDTKDKKLQTQFQLVTTQKYFQLLSKFSEALVNLTVFVCCSFSPLSHKTYLSQPPLISSVFCLFIHYTSFEFIF
jgi:hypothetical protein